MESREDAFEALAIFGALAASSVGIAQLNIELKPALEKLSLVFVFLAFMFIIIAVSMPKEKHMTVKEYKLLSRTQRRIVYEVEGPNHYH